MDESCSTLIRSEKSFETETTSGSGRNSREKKCLEWRSTKSAKMFSICCLKPSASRNNSSAKQWNQFSSSGFFFYASQQWLCVGTCWNIFHQRSQLRNQSNHIHGAGRRSFGVCWTERETERAPTTTAAAFTWRHFHWKVILNESLDVCVLTALECAVSATHGSYTKFTLRSNEIVAGFNSDWWLSTWSVLSFLWFPFSARLAALRRNRFRWIWVFEQQRNPNVSFGGCSKWIHMERKQNKAIGNGLSCASTLGSRCK